MIGTVVRRALVPLLLLAGGIAAVVYGAVYREIPVNQEREVEETIRLPAPFGALPPMPGGPSMDPGAFPGGPSPFEPQFITQKVPRIVKDTKKEHEPRLVREVSVGGVKLNDGEIWRTYSGEGGPSLCPS